MTKNTIGGKGHKKAKKQNVDLKNIPVKNENDGTDYGIVKSILGNGRMIVLCLSDKKERLGHIRGSIYKKTWIGKDDVILISIRDFQNEKCDVLFKYSSDEVKYLIKNGQINSNYNRDENDQEDENDCIFVEDEEEKSNEIDIDIDDI